MLPRACRSVTALSMMMGLVAASHADDWGTVVAISSTMGVQGDRVCVGEATRGDIGCPTYAPQVLPDGTVSATNGEFSRLRVISGTFAVNEGASNRGVGLQLNTDAFGKNVWQMRSNGSAPYPVLIDVGDRKLLYVNYTTANRPAIGIGTTDPSTALHVSGTLRIADSFEACDASRVGAIRYAAGEFSFCRNGTVWEPLSSISGDADRIVSGTTSLVAVSSSGFVSLTQTGTNTGWFDPARGLVTLGVSATGVISGTMLATTDRIYFSNTGQNVFVGQYTATSSNDKTAVTAMGYAAVMANRSNYVTGVGSYAAQYSSGTYVVALGHGAAQYNSGSYVTAVGSLAAQYNSGSYVTALGNTAGYSNTGASSVMVGTSAGYGNTGNNATLLGRSAGISNTFTNVTALGYNAQPDKDNQIVLGNASIVEVSTAGVILARGLNTSGTVTATRFVGDGSGLTGVVASTADRIVSGTTSLVAVSNTGFVSLTQAGTNTGWFDPARGLVALGVSATGVISATGGYFQGTARITSWTMINSTTAPTLPLEVAGTGVLARFGDGSGGSAAITVNSAPGNVRDINFASSRSGRWTIRTTGLTESGANAGSNFQIQRRDDSGSAIDAPFYIIRQTGYTGIGGVQNPNAPLEVSGTVSATYVKLADNDDKPCAPENNGTIRFFNGRISLCRTH